MITDGLYRIIGGLGDQEGQGLIFIVLAGVLVLFVFGLLRLIPRPLAASLMTSLGILGTFCGVFIALQSLDFFTPGKINDSIQQLLNGMKIAFVTSLIGLAGSIASRFAWSLLEKFPSSLMKSPIETSPEHDDISRKLEDIKNAIAGEGDSSLVTQMQKLRNENRDSFGKLEDIKNAIAGEGDSSLVAQMQQLRDENRDSFARLDATMVGLSDTIRNQLVESLQQLIIELRDIIANQLGTALRQLIDNIEKALIEQFGKTFVEFNQGVQAIKRWQEDHREQVEQLTAAFRQTQQGIADIEKSLVGINRQVETIPVTMEALGDTINNLNQLIETANGQVDDLEQRLQAFSDMKANAEAAFPTIQENLQGILDDLDGFQEKIRVEIEGVAKAWGENLIAVAEKAGEAIEAAGEGGQ